MFITIQSVLITCNCSLFFQRCINTFHMEVVHVTYNYINLKDNKFSFCDITLCKNRPYFEPSMSQI